MNGQANFFRGGIAANLLDSIIAYWKFENNVLDSVDANDGVAYGVTYTDGLVGRKAVFNGSSSKVVIEDSVSNANFSFTDGVNDLPFSFSFIITWSDLNDGWIIDRRNITSGREYQVIYYQGGLRFQLFGTSGSTQINAIMPFSPTIGLEYKMAFTYDASKSENGLKLYIDKILQATTNTMVGVYNGMFWYGRPFTVGGASWSSTVYFGGTIDELIVWRKGLTQENVDFIVDEQNLGNHLI